jgi:putative tryptophan/tyrosine transport system substrate-binding protein
MNDPQPEGHMASHIERRKFLATLGSAVAAWPLAARAQQPAKLPTIGYLGATTAAAQKPWTEAFLQRLHELGWIEGRTLAIEYRWGEGRNERLAEIAAEFVRLKVDVILAAGTASALASKQATATIPVVFGLAGDPLGTGLVASLARPGGNVTGLSNQAVDLAGKRLEILREVVPNFRRLAILANAEYPGGKLEKDEIQAAARTLGVEVTASEIRRTQDIGAVLDTVKDRADALYVVGDPLLNSNRVRISTLAVGARLPTMYVQREYVEAGGLMSYGANIPNMFRRAADYVDKVLRGAKAGDLPVEQPTQFEFVVNLTTARALGLEIPPTLLARADEVIE